MNRIFVPLWYRLLHELSVSSVVEEGKVKHEREWINRRYGLSTHGTAFEWVLLLKGKRKDGGRYSTHKSRRCYETADEGRVGSSKPIPGSDQQAPFYWNVLPVCLRFKRQFPNYEVYQQPVTAERKHADRIPPGTVDVFVLWRFFRCISTSLIPECAPL